MKNKIYCAIIGDINKSRLLPDRNHVQRKFQSSISRINKEYKNSIASKFLVTLGDEFQGLLKSGGESYRLVRRLQDMMGDVPFSFGIGIGTLSTSLKKEALGMDGECFHRARAALLKAKKKKQEVLYDFDGSACTLVNAMIELLEKERESLTERQREIMQLLKNHNSAEVAHKLKISPQAISKVRKTTVVSQMNGVEEALHTFLEIAMQQPKEVDTAYHQL